MSTEQKVVTVLNTDTDINAEIITQTIDNWFVTLMTLWSDNTNMVILFTRQVIPT